MLWPSNVFLLKIINKQTLTYNTNIKTLREESAGGSGRSHLWADVTRVKVKHCAVFISYTLQEFCKMNCRIFVNELTGKTLSVYVDSEEELRNMTVKELKRRVCPDLPCESSSSVWFVWTSHHNYMRKWFKHLGKDVD